MVVVSCLKEEGDPNITPLARENFIHPARPHPGQSGAKNALNYTAEKRELLGLTEEQMHISRLSHLLGVEQLSPVPSAQQGPCWNQEPTLFLPSGPSTQHTHTLLPPQRLGQEGTVMLDIKTHLKVCDFRKFMSHKNLNTC